jgi:signal transduction histidine kinase
LNKTHSLRFYILSFFTVTSVITFILLGSYVAYNYHAELKTNLCNSLTVMADDVIRHKLYKVPADEIHLSFHYLESYHDDPFVQLFDHLEFSYSTEPLLATDALAVINRKLSDGRYLNISSTLINVDAKTLALTLKLFMVFGTALLLFILIFTLLLNRLLSPLHALVRYCNNGSEDHSQIERCDGTSDINSLRNAILQLIDDKQELFKEAAHEIKSPIAILKARISLYKQDDNYDKQQFVDESLEDIDTITSKLKEILFLKAVEYDMRQTKEEVSMQSQCYLMQQAFRPIFDKKELMLEANWNDDFSLYTHKDAIGRVMQAIFENIFLHTKNGTVIRVDVDSERQHLRITNEVGQRSDEKLFSSSIGSKIINRLAPQLGYVYTTEQEGNLHTTLITFINKNNILQHTS